MGKRTGKPRGRPRGAPNQHTRERENRIAQAAAAIESAIPEAFKGDAHAFLIAVYKNPDNPLPVRIDAAKAAIGFEKPKLAALQHSGDQQHPLTFAILTGVPRPDDDDVAGTGANDDAVNFGAYREK